MKNLLNKFRKDNKGFTLVELIIVVAILAVLMAVLAPQYIRYVEKSRQGVDASALNEVKHAVEVEAALLENIVADTTVTVKADGTIEGAGSFVSTTDAYKSLTKTVGTKINFKSNATKSFASGYKITVSTDGKVAWDGESATGGTPTENSAAAMIVKLQSGTATATSTSTGDE